ncbi:MAG TPA: glucosaminidase domain-containing protein, partial [Steroidobacteraceae bacterium]
GIKAGSSWKGASVQANTEEFAGGVASRVDANFRAYGSSRESVEDYVRVIRDNPRYASALNTGSDVQAFATALQKGGYATDPEYARKLVSVAAEVGQRVAANPFKSGSAEPIPAQGPLRMSNG